MSAGDSGGDNASGAYDVDWSKLMERLPVGKDTASALRRGELFNRMDVNGNGVLSLAEVDKAVRDVLGLDSLYSAKPVLMRAFQAAKSTNNSKAKKRPSRKGLNRDDYVERDEFRLLLVYMRQYFEYFVAFNRINVDDDHKLSLEEFRLAVTNGTLLKFGISLKEDEADEVFASIDGNNGGSILFDEFCHWAIKENLDVDDDDDYDPQGSVGFKSALAGAGHKQHKVQKALKQAAVPAWKQRLTDQRQAASTVSAKIISAAASKEQAAAERLAQLKARANREFTRAASLARIEEHKERKRMQAAETKAENDKLSGRDVSTLVASIDDLGEDEVVALSKKFNEALNKYDPDVRNFFTLFKAMDIDGSRRISFTELEELIRHRLGLKERHLTQTQILGLWKRLDENLSGFIDAGELSRFLRIGQSKELTPAQLARKKLQQARERQMDQIREESRKRLEKSVAAKSQQVEKATDEEVRKFGELFNKNMKGTDISNFFALFKSMDMDGSGKVKFSEFECMVRSTLKVNRTDVSDEHLFSLWAAIDDNKNGFICNGEFVRFMRKSSEGLDEAERLDQNHAAEASQKIRELQALEEIKKEETWARHRALQSVQKAKALEQEAERIERLLADFDALRGKTNALRASAAASKSPVLSGKKSRSHVKADFSPHAASAEDQQHVDEDEDGSAVPSPGGQSAMGSTMGSTAGGRKQRVTSSSIRADALGMLAREVNRPVMSMPKRSGSMILPTLKREEGQL